MKLHVNSKKGSLLYESVVGLVLLGGFATVIFDAWHSWNQTIQQERTSLNHERTELNEIRQKL
jgi:hypothetical protein